MWDLATGTLKLTLTGHINTVRGLAVSPRHPYPYNLITSIKLPWGGFFLTYTRYLFSCGEDKQIKCWDLEYNKYVSRLSFILHASTYNLLKSDPTVPWSPFSSLLSIDSPNHWCHGYRYNNLFVLPSIVAYLTHGIQVGVIWLLVCGICVPSKPCLYWVVTKIQYFPSLPSSYLVK